MTRILWLDLNCSYAHSSLALPALHAQIMNDGEYQHFSWSKVSATTSMPISNTVAEIAAYQPDIIAGTLWLFNHETMMHILGRVNAILPKCRIILGGPEFLGDNETFLRANPFVSCVFRGEGEEEFPKWLNIWNRPQLWNEITGLCFLDEENEYRDNGKALVIDFAALKYPEESPFFNWEKPFVQLETTRGCFNTCAFCISGGEKPVRSLNIETVRSRIETIHKHGIRNIRVLDRTFNYNSRRATEMLSLFQEFSPDIQFHLEIHPALLTESLKQLLPALPAGLLHLEAGIQSLRPDVLSTAKRSGELDKALEGLRFLCQLPNMETHADLIAGLPLYTYKQIIEDIHTLSAFQAGEIQLESLKLLPGTEMRLHAERLGIRYSPFPPYEVLQTNEITPEELLLAHGLSRILDGYYNTTEWREVMQRIFAASPHFLTGFLSYLMDAGLIDQPLSMEKRGLLLYDFCRKEYAEYLTEVSFSWIAAGLSLRRDPALNLQAKATPQPEKWRIIKGNYDEKGKLYFLPSDTGGHWFGFEYESQNRVPVFIASI